MCLTLPSAMAELIKKSSSDHNFNCEYQCLLLLQKVV